MHYDDWGTGRHYAGGGEIFVFRSRNKSEGRYNEKEYITRANMIYRI
jgi:hypothetical protein